MIILAALHLKKVLTLRTNLHMFDIQTLWCAGNYSLWWSFKVICSYISVEGKNLPVGFIGRQRSRVVKMWKYLRSMMD